MNALQQTRAGRLGRFAALGWVAVVAALLAWPLLGWSEGPREEEYARVAREIRALVKKKGVSAVAIGKFAGRQRDESYGEPDIRQNLIDALKRQGVDVSRKADLTVSGMYRKGVNAAKRPVLQVTFRVTDETDAPVGSDIVARITDNSYLGRIVGATATIDDGSTDTETAHTIARGIDNPSVHVEGNLVRSSKDSPYAVEVRAGPAGGKGDMRSRRPSVKDGQAWVTLEKGEEYQVWVHNKSDKKVLFTLSIDGLSAFTFSDVRKENGQPESSFFDWSAGLAYPVKGWYQTQHKSLAFLVTDYGKGASHKAPPSSRRTEERGVITVVFSGERQGGGRNFVVASAPLVETGAGREVEAKYSRSKATLGDIRSIVSIRYSPPKAKR